MFISSVIYLILYSSANVPLNKSYIQKFLNEKNNPLVSKFDIKKVTALDSVIMFPVNSQNMNEKTFPLPSSRGVNNSELATHCTCNSESNCLGNSEGESLDTVVNSDCFNDHDHSFLGNVDPTISYLNSNNNVKNAPYYNDQSFSKKFHRSNDSLSMFHLNIRSIPDHILELTSLLNNLSIELKIKAISETWIKPYHINYNIPNYNLEQDFCLHKRGRGVCLAPKDTAYTR